MLLFLGGNLPSMFSAPFVFHSFFLVIESIFIYVLAIFSSTASHVALNSYSTF